jgi:hypothetical protein
MPRSYAILLAAVLLSPGAAPAQRPEAPRKRTTAVAPGMTPAQVRQVLGEPVRVRREGALTYMEYPNGCSGCTADFVVVEKCRVVGARFENPSRQFLTTPVADRSEPPADECRASESGVSHVDAVAYTPATARVAPPADTTPRTPPPPRDTGPGGMIPADRPTAGAATLPEAPAQEGNPDAWRKRLTLRRPATHVVAVPAASLSSPTAFGVQMGEGFAGFSYQARTRYTDLDDGAAAIGIGLGNRRVVALETTISSYSTVRGGGPLETGGLNFKLHHAFGDSWGVALGWENAVDWGGSDAGNSPYAVVTRIVRLNDDSRRPLSAIALSGGVGAGRFRSESAIVDDKSTVNVFGSVGVQVAEPLSAIADWNGQDLYAGVSLAPIRRVPLLVNAGFADITGNAGDGARFVLSAGVGFRWLPPFF